MTRKWRNYDVATIALRQAGGADGHVHHEKVAVKARKIAPERFSWSLPEFQEFPDKDLVRVSLYDAEKKRNGGMVESFRNDEGVLFWRLTSRGAEFCARHESKILDSHDRGSSQSGRTQHKNLLGRIRSSRLWKEYKSGALDGASEILLTELLRLPPDSSSSKIGKHLDRLRAQVELTRDAEVLEFLGAVGSRFEALVGQHKDTS